MGRLKSHSLEFKRTVISHARTPGNSLRATAAKFAVTRKMVRSWVRTSEKIEETASSRHVSAKKHFRLAGGGRKVKSKELEEALYAWYLAELDTRNAISRRRIILHARELRGKISETKPEVACLALSKGWLDRFLARHKLTLRRTTTVCQKPPAEYVNKICDFIQYVRDMIKERKVKLSHVYGADETSVWLDPPNSTSIAPIGSRDVPVRVAGHEKQRVTVMLTARASGEKCLLLVLIPRKRVVKEVEAKFKGKLVLKWPGKTWMDDSLTEAYLHDVIGPQLFEPKLLIWDAFRCHTSVKTKGVLRSLRVQTAVIPGGCTKFIQPADVSWNRLFRQMIQCFHDDWLSSDDLPTTVGGNLRAPSLDVYLQWVVDAWSSISTDIIVKSFRTCGISLKHDGSEDEEIHLFKETGPCPESLNVLKDKIASGVTARVQPAEDFVTIDPLVIAGVQPAEGIECRDPLVIELEGSTTEDVTTSDGDFDGDRGSDVESSEDEGGAHKDD